MVTPAFFEDSMKENERTKNLRSAVKDVSTILNQYGFKSGADIFERMIMPCIEEVKNEKD